MLFFALVGIAAILIALAMRLIRGRVDIKAAMRLSLAAALIFFGFDHLITPQRYLPMMPSAIPYPLQIVYFTGLCEIAGAIGLLIPRLRVLAGIMLALYFVAVFPANIRNALYGLDVDGLPSERWYYWARLPFQPLVIAWVLYCSGAWDRLRRRAAKRRLTRLAD